MGTRLYVKEGARKHDIYDFKFYKFKFLEKFIIS